MGQVRRGVIDPLSGGGEPGLLSRALFAASYRPLETLPKLMRKEGVTLEVGWQTGIKPTKKKPSGDNTRGKRKPTN